MMVHVSLKNVTVEYPIYNANARSIRRSLIDIGTGGRISEEGRETVNITALQGIDLELSKGERLGLIGHNGSGKSTLLRTIAGIYSPVRGSLSTSGRISTVFGLGAGMEPELTGYENIVRMGMMLGASRGQAEASIPEIEAFSQLGGFLSVPVRTYSDGMMTRLSFAVATAAQPEILLVDEVLGAGDAEFQDRARKRMHSFIENSSIFVLASHDDNLLRTFCKRAIRMEHGEIVESIDFF